MPNSDLVRRVPFLSCLTPAQAGKVAAAATRKRARRGELILEQGKRGGQLVIIVSGRVRVTRSDGRGGEVLLAFLHPGEWLGEMSLIDNGPHSANCRVDAACELLVLDGQDFAQLLATSSAMAMAVMRGLVRTLRRANRRIESLALMDVYGRVARTLVECAQPHGEGTLLIPHRISQLDLGRMVGASREMVGRVMKDLVERGLVQAQPDGSLVLRESMRTLPE